MSPLSRSRLSLAVLLMLFFLPLTGISAELPEQFNWAAQGSIFYWAADNGKKDVDPAPIIPSGGVTFTWKFVEFFRVELTEDIYFTNYEYRTIQTGNSTFGYAVASNPENRSAFVLGFLTGLQLTGFIPFGSNGMGLRIYGGPSIDLRIVTRAFGLNYEKNFPELEEELNTQIENIRKYFWSEGRWFYPVAGIGMDFPVNSKILLGFDLRCWFPIYRFLGTDKELPAIDGWRFGVSFRITPRKNRVRENEQETEPINQPINQPIEVPAVPPPAQIIEPEPEHENIDYPDIDDDQIDT